MMPIDRLRLGDVVSGSLILALGAAALLWLIEAHVRVVPQFGADAHLYPRVLAVLLTILGSSILIGGLVKSAASPAVSAVPRGGLFRVLFIVLGAAGFSLLIPYTGFLPAAMLAVGIFAMVSGVRKPLALVALSVGTAVAVHVLAVELLGLSLPG